MKHSRITRRKKTLKHNKRSINKRAGAIVDKIHDTVGGVIGIVNEAAKGTEKVTGSTFTLVDSGLKTANAAVRLPGKVLDTTGKIVDATGNTGAIFIDTTGKIVDASGKTGIEALKTSSKILKATGEVADVSGKVVSSNLEEAGKLSKTALSVSNIGLTRTGEIGNTVLEGTNQTLGGVLAMGPIILGSISTALKQSTDLVAHSGSEIVITVKDIISLPLAIIRFPILALKKVFDTLNAKLTTTTNPQEIQAIKEDQSKVIAEIAKTEQVAEEKEKQLLANPDTSSIKLDEPSEITDALADSTDKVVDDLAGKLQSDVGKEALQEVEEIADKLEEKGDELEKQEKELKQIRQGGKRTRKNRTRNKSKYLHRNIFI
jgi:hypothetical protein